MLQGQIIMLITQRSAIKQHYIDHHAGGPVYDGEVKIEVDGNNITVTLDCMDDNGHKIVGTFTCSGMEFYDRSNKQNTPTTNNTLIGQGVDSESTEVTS